MREVFEKIIEKLESKLLNLTCQRNERNIGFNDGIHKAIEIVKKIAAEYNNGWIPVENKLPDKIQEETPDDCCPEYIVMIDGVNEATVLKYSPDGEWFDENGFVYKVIAWQPLPESYQSKGE